MADNIQLSDIFTYPVKSLSGISLQQANVTPIGLLNDRTLMLVDQHGQFISQRKYPQLALLKTSFNAQSLEVTNHSEQLIISDSDFEKTMEVEVWGDKCFANKANKKVNQWFSHFLGISVALVKYDQNRPRAIAPDYSIPGDNVSFADGFPLLLTSMASLDDLNQRLDLPVSMLHFRPNVVIQGCSAFEEDNWKQIRIGQVKFDLAKPCSRCILTTVNPQTGVRRSDGEPLKTLAQYRKGNGGVYFGMNLIPRNKGIIQLGDSIEIIS